MHTTKGFIFRGTSTTLEERKILRDAGFVHVTGLTAMDGQCNPQYVIGEDVGSSHVGKHDNNNGKYVIVTPGGEWWIRAVINRLPVPREIFRRLCPNGQGAFVPCTNGEEILMSDLLDRVADPDYGLFTPDGTPVGEIYS